jgi:hypothetical protein
LELAPRLEPGTSCLGFEEARSLTQPSMSYVRNQLRGRLTARLAGAHRRWLHPTSGRQPGERFP